MMESSNLCPFCQEAAIKQCSCRRRCMACKNDHSWHLCAVHNCIVLAAGTHSMRSAQCSCLAGQSLQRISETFISNIGTDTYIPQPLTVTLSRNEIGEELWWGIKSAIVGHECQHGCKTCYDELIESVCQE